MDNLMRDETKYWVLDNGSYMETTDTWAETDPDHPGAVTDPDGQPWVLAVHTEVPVGAKELTAAEYKPQAAAYEAAQVAADAQRAADSEVARAKSVAAAAAAAPSRAIARAAVLTRLGLTEADLALLLTAGPAL